MSDLFANIRRTTAIGSLPHHNIDTALAFSFQLGIPFLPQIPIRNPWEFMIAQALEDLPGLQVEADGATLLNLDVWSSRTHRLSQRLDEAFRRADSDPEAFESFEPSSAAASCWQPFLWELDERGLKLAKIQLAGPMTAQWALKLQGGQSVDRHPDLTTQIYRLVLARGIAMVRRLKSVGVTPLLYLDEPGLYAYSSQNPKHVLAFQELKLVIATLRKEGALVGIHCCSNTDWNAVLELPIHVLSLDTTLSLPDLLAPSRHAKLEAFIAAGGRLSLGAVPTSLHAGLARAPEPRVLVAQLLDTFAAHLSGKAPSGGASGSAGPEFVKQILRDAIYTPACGLALHGTADAELILGALQELYGYLAKDLHLA